MPLESIPRDEWFTFPPTGAGDLAQAMDAAWGVLQRAGALDAIESVWSSRVPEQLTAFLGGAGLEPAGKEASASLEKLEMILLCCGERLSDPEQRFTALAAALLINRLNYAITLTQTSQEIDYLSAYRGAHTGHRRLMLAILESCARGEIGARSAEELLRKLDRMPPLTGVHAAIRRERRAWLARADEPGLSASDRLLLEGVQRYVGWLHVVADAPLSDRPAELAFARGLIDPSVRDENLIELSSGAFFPEEHAAVTHDLARIALAMIVYRNERGRWPSALPQLAPGQMVALPRDAAANAPYRIRVVDGANAIVYSIGADGADGNGEGAPLNVAALGSTPAPVAGLDFVVHVKDASAGNPLP